MYLYIFLHTYVNVYLHILHNHIGIHIPEETKVTRVMLVIFFVISMTKCLTKRFWKGSAYFTSQCEGKVYHKDTGKG